MCTKKLIFLSFIVLSLNSIAQTIDYSLIPYRKGDKWGYADPQRNIVITPKYNEAQWFSEGLAAVRVGSKWGYINKQGRLVIPAKFTVAKSFRKGYVPRINKAGGDSVLFAGASTTANGYERCITAKGVILTKCPAINENSVVENRIPVQTKTTQKTYSLANNNGLFDKVIDDYKIAGSDETYYIAQKNNLYGVFNSKFETIIPFEYSTVKQLTSNNNLYLQVQRNGMYGILNANGQPDISTDYSSMDIVNGNNVDYLIVKRDGKTYVKDMMNNDIISSGYSEIVYDNNGGFVITDNNNMRGFYFSDKRIINPKYSDVRIVNRGSNYLQIKTSNGKVGYINAAGDEYFME